MKEFKIASEDLAQDGPRAEWGGRRDEGPCSQKHQNRLSELVTRMHGKKPWWDHDTWSTFTRELGGFDELMTCRDLCWDNQFC